MIIQTGNDIKSLRVSVLGLSQERFAEKIGLTSKNRKNYVSEIETGKKPVPFIRLIAYGIVECVSIDH